MHFGTVKPVLIGHSKNDKTKVLKTNGSSMNVESISECYSAILLTCIKRYSVLKTNFGVLFEWPLKTGFTVNATDIKSRQYFQNILT